MDVQTEGSSKKVLIELELVLDIYSLVFCNIRFYLEKYYQLEVPNQEVSNLYGKELKIGIKDVLAPKLAEVTNEEEIDIDQHVDNILKGFKESAASLKPAVPSIHILNSLKKDCNVTISAFTYIETDIISSILPAGFTDLVEEVVSIHDIIKNPEQYNADYSIIIFGCMAYYLELAILGNEKKENIVHVEHPKNTDGLILEVESYKNLDKIPFENFDLPKLTPCYEGSLMRVDLNREFKTSELPFWKTTIPLDKIELKGRVVNGYKRGSKELGVPTANLETCHENILKIDNLLPGVYCGTIQFLSYESHGHELLEKYGENFKEKKLMTALSIGWNPCYDNKKRTIEAYILEEFDNDFYGEELKIEITHYIRAESNYTTLDHLIMAIHNDIETTKQTISL